MPLSKATRLRARRCSGPPTSRPASALVVENVTADDELIAHARTRRTEVDALPVRIVLEQAEVPAVCAAGFLARGRERGHPQPDQLTRFIIDMASAPFLGGGFTAAHRLVSMRSCRQWGCYLTRRL
jgi:hypothetical protein